MNKIESKITQMMQNDDYSEQQFKQLLKIMNVIDKNVQVDKNAGKLVFNFIDSVFQNTENIAKFLPVLVQLTHFVNLINFIINQESRIYFTNYNFYDLLNNEITDIDRLIYITLSLIDLQLDNQIIFPAVQVIEGISYYQNGKRKCIFCGAIEILDQIISQYEQQFTDNFDMNMCSLLECFSNLIGTKQVRQLKKWNEQQGKEVFVIENLQSYKSIFNAVLNVRNTKQALCATSCLFSILLDNIKQFMQLGYINNQLIQKLVMISCCYEEQFGGKQASLCLILIYGYIMLQKFSSQVNQEQINILCEEVKQNENYQKDEFIFDIEKLLQIQKELSTETDFLLFRNSIKVFKFYNKLLKRHQLYSEMQLLLSNQNLQQQQETDFISFLQNKYIDSIENIHFWNQQELQNNEYLDDLIINNSNMESLNDNYQTDRKSQFESKTTGNMRTGQVRTRAKSSLDDW